ncbi:serine protease [Ruegeria litorea]|uniref:Serine protease n=1 Tax=Falsiruegeria litorea TaxID=1280831 RepID=A0ABS5WN44_9RHOB|nr:serine protease [Falsiruegeria litorea]MBT3140438.1 serine protease [Falsiruegeria litorea]
MKITDLKDIQSIENTTRFENMIKRIKSTEDSIMARAQAIESGLSSDTMVFQRSHIEPADLPRLFVAERMVGETNDILSIEFFEAGLVAKRPVGRVLDGIGSYATGFLIGNDLMMTAAHALPGIAEASIHEFQMDYETHSIGTPVSAPRYSLDPDRFYFVNETYDVAIVAVTDFTGLNPSLDSYGWIVLDPRDETIKAPQPISIIQHPQGREKSIVVHNSRFVHCENNSNDERFCWYTGDTERGSSGAPVFDPQWNLLALHHQAIPDTNDEGEILDRQGRPIVIDGQKIETLNELQELGNVGFVANQGVRQSRIFRLLENSRMDDPTQDTLRKELLASWCAPGAKARARASAIRALFPPNR